MPDLMTMTPDEIADTLRTEAIAQQNDRFRRAICGAPDGFPVPPGRCVLTRTVADPGDDFILVASRAVGAFESFTEDNNPHGERDFGAVTVWGVTLFWKIDLYDPAYAYGSDDRADVRRTRRVLTIMRPEDY